jgi:hypothetical protein
MTLHRSLDRLCPCLRASPLALLAALGCSITETEAGPRPDPVVAPEGGAAGPSVQGPGSSPMNANPLTGGSGGVQPSAAPPNDGTCVSTRAQAELIRSPVDIVVVLDNSLSMSDEAASVEVNLNESFARILNDAGIDYRLILISEHRSSQGQGTAVCIDSPLSGLAQCPGEQPVFTDRFFHYSTEIGSRDSFDVLLETYSGQSPDEYGLAPSGWSAWLRAGAQKVFLEISDDDARLAVASFLTELTTIAPEHFGSDAQHPNLVWHSIVGLAEKLDPVEAHSPDEPVELEECTGNQNNVFNPGEKYQELSRQTGGLRFPICQFAAYDTVFQAIADSVLETSGIACGFPLASPPPGQRLELDKVAVSYTPGDGSASIVFGQVTDPADCQPLAFVVGAGEIQLCPQACDLVRADTSARLDVLFTCESTVIVR